MKEELFAQEALQARANALVTDELAAQLEAGKMVKLDKDDWNCGERKVVVDNVIYTSRGGNSAK